MPFVKCSLLCLLTNMSLINSSCYYSLLLSTWDRVSHVEALSRVWGSVWPQTHRVAEDNFEFLPLPHLYLLRDYRPVPATLGLYSARAWTYKFTRDRPTNTPSMDTLPANPPYFPHNVCLAHWGAGCQTGLLENEEREKLWKIILKKHLKFLPLL